MAALDGAFTVKRSHDGCHLHGPRHPVVAGDFGQQDFAVLEIRRIVERSFGEPGRLDRLVARLAFVAVLPGMDAILDPKPAKVVAR